MNSPIHRQIRLLLWLYMILWAFEGALRFWVFPGLYGPLALVRDPVVIIIYALALQNRALPMNMYVSALLVLAMLSVPASILFGHGDLTVTAYGVRSNFLHLPLMFMIGHVFRARDLQKLAGWIMLLSVPMAVLAADQFRSPAGALINKGGMATHYGTVRPAGTFAFVLALVYFQTLVAAFTAHRLMKSPRAWGLVAIASAFSLFVMVSVSGSRTAVVAVAVIVVLALALAIRAAKQLVPMLVGLALVAALVGGFGSSELLEDGTEQLAKRFRDAGSSGSVVSQAVDRVFGGTLGVTGNIWDYDWLGQGVGLGTNFGGQTFTGKRGAFLVGEGEWSRVMGELGIILGLPFLIIRTGLVFYLATRAWTAHVRYHDPLPFLLFGAACIPMLMGQWGVPALQGFAPISAGLCLAAANAARRAYLEQRMEKTSSDESLNELALPAPHHAL